MTTWNQLSEEIKITAATTIQEVALCAFLADDIIFKDVLGFVVCEVFSKNKRPPKKEM